MFFIDSQGEESISRKRPQPDESTPQETEIVSQIGEHQNCNVWFQKISILPPQRVIGNFKWGGGFLRPKSLKESMSLS